MTGAVVQFGKGAVETGLKLPPFREPNRVGGSLPGQLPLVDGPPRRAGEEIELRSAEHGGVAMALHTPEALEKVVQASRDYTLQERNEATVPRGERPA